MLSRFTANICLMLFGLMFSACEPTNTTPIDGTDELSWSRELVLNDIGRISANTIGTNLHVQNLLRAGDVSEALAVLNSSLPFDVTYLKLFDEKLSDDERHIRLRNKVLVGLKKLWLEFPPPYLDEEAARFIEEGCAKLPDCPDGKLIGEESAREGSN